MMDFFDSVLIQAKAKMQLIEAAEEYKRYLLEWIDTHDTVPHCDPRVLHSPRLCGTCDHYPQLQTLRRNLGLKFTDELRANDALLPGEDRTRASVEAWGGNGVS